MRKNGVKSRSFRSMTQASTPSFADRGASFTNPAVAPLCPSEPLTGRRSGHTRAPGFTPFIRAQIRGRSSDPRAASTAFVAGRETHIAGTAAGSTWPPPAPGRARPARGRRCTHESSDRGRDPTADTRGEHRQSRSAATVGSASRLLVSHNICLRSRPGFAPPRCGVRARHIPLRRGIEPRSKAHYHGGGSSWCRRAALPWLRRR
jgi:hypothetical protein